jgi:hypothetical protein
LIQHNTPIHLFAKKQQGKVHIEFVGIWRPGIVPGLRAVTGLLLADTRRLAINDVLMNFFTESRRTANLNNFYSKYYFGVSIALNNNPIYQ